MLADAGRHLVRQVLQPLGNQAGLHQIVTDRGPAVVGSARRTHMPSAMPTPNWTAPSRQPPKTNSSVWLIMMSFDQWRRRVRRIIVSDERYPLKT